MAISETFKGQKYLAKTPCQQITGPKIYNTFFK
jgi:hypothetical protein